MAGAGKVAATYIYTAKSIDTGIAGKTILSFIVGSVANASITEFIFIVGYLMKIQEYVNRPIPISPAILFTRTKRQGTGHAIELTKNIVGDDEVFKLGDTICDFDVKEVIKSEFSMLGIKRLMTHVTATLV